MKICSPSKSYTCMQLIWTFFNRIFTGNLFFLYLAKLNHGNLLESSAWQVIMVAVYKKVDNFDLDTSYFLIVSNSVLYLYCWWLWSVVCSTDKMSPFVQHVTYKTFLLILFTVLYMYFFLRSLHKCIDR